jgi:hypothetical protein
VSEEQPAPVKRSRKLYVLWATALTLLLALGLVCWLVVVPVFRVRDTHEVIVKVDFPRIQPPDDVFSPQEAIEALGGRQRAATRLKMYLRCHHQLLPIDPSDRQFYRVKAVRLLGWCNEHAADTLEGVLKDETGEVCQAAAEALDKIKAAESAKEQE